MVRSGRGGEEWEGWGGMVRSGRGGAAYGTAGVHVRCNREHLLSSLFSVLCNTEPENSTMQ